MSPAGAAARRVVLLGMKHSGKSTLGLRLAGLWRCAFHDTDAALEASWASGGGERLEAREIYRRLGADGFFDAEARALRELAAVLSPEAGHVLAAGGRTPLNPLAGPLLRSLGLAVFLELPAEALWERVAAGGIPSFLASEDPRREFLALARERDPQYRAFADLTVPLDAGASAEENVRRLARAIEAAWERSGQRSG